MKGVRNKKITDLLDSFFALSPPMKVGEATEINNAPDAFMSFHIDLIGMAAGNPIFAFSHYYRHPSGDMIADPDMQVIYEWEGKKLYPFTYQDGLKYEESYNPSTGELKPQLQKEHAELLAQWLKNVVEQQKL